MVISGTTREDHSGIMIRLLILKGSPHGGGGYTPINSQMDHVSDYGRAFRGSYSNWGRDRPNEAEDHYTGTRLSETKNKSKVGAHEGPLPA